MDSENIVEIIRGGEYSPCEQSTPSENSPLWNDAIYEAREYGIHVSAFGDTIDKFVITPKDLGYDFDYAFGNGSWTSVDGCYQDMTDEEKLQAYYRLIEIAKFLDKKCDVSMVFIRGNGKGYISTSFQYSGDGFRLENEHGDQFVVETKNVVIFCYADRYELADSIENKIPTKKELTAFSPLHVELYWFLKDVYDYDIFSVKQILRHTKTVDWQLKPNGKYEKAITKKFVFTYGDNEEVVELEDDDAV